MKTMELKNARLLIVDDQESNVLFLECLLQEGGYTQYRSLQDSRLTLQVCLEYQPDLILLDLMMPHLDGFGVMEQLQAWLKEQDYLPIVVLTADANPQSRRRALANGAKDFLLKPLDAVEVLLRVKNLLETRFLYRERQQRASERIQEQATLIEQATDAIIVHDLDDRITFWNSAAERIYGWRAEEVVGKVGSEFLFQGPSREWEEAQQVILQEGMWTGELRQVSREGKQVIVASRWTLLRDSEGRAKSKLLINTDITEKKKLEVQYLRAQRTESIGLLAGGIAHDLNNVLTPVMMGVDLLRRKNKDPNSQVLLGTMQTSIRRGAEMVQHILTFARGVEGNRQPLQMEPLVCELIKLLKQTFPKSITIQDSLPKDLWLVSADPTHLHQVLANLCVNARDAMPMGGQLTIKAENHHIRPEDTRLNADLQPGPHVVLEVEDSGTGIPANVVEKIFDPFFTTKEVGKGTGLGLSTVLGIIKKHRGSVKVYSVPGKGTRFIIYLPAMDLPAASPAPMPLPELPGGQGELLLIVDDEPILLQLAQATLSGAGYRVLTAPNGEAGLALYRQHPAISRHPNTIDLLAL